MDKEERELQIRLAQLNARLQRDLAWIFGCFATSLGFSVFAYQIWKDNVGLALVVWVGALVFIAFTMGWIQRSKTSLRELDNLK